jgi:hypothetical protein
MFVTTDELNKHIRKEHSIHCWACDYCAPTLPEDQIMIFDTAQDWILHVTESHFPNMPLSRFEALSEMSMRTMVGPISCPLCNFCTTTAQPEVEEHVTWHMHSFALRALPWGVGDNRKDSEAPDSGVKSKSSSDSQNSDTEYLGVSPYDSLPEITELKINIGSEIKSYLQSDKIHQVKLPSGFRIFLDDFCSLIDTVDETKEYSLPCLTRIYCVLFQMKEARPPNSLIHINTYIFSTDTISEFHDCLMHEIERLYEKSVFLDNDDAKTETNSSDIYSDISTEPKNFRDSLGLITLFEPQVPTIADLIFVHGEDGGSKSTWTSSNEPVKYWPQEWLSQSLGFTDIRIHAYGYEPNQFLKSMVTVSEHAQLLLSSIRDCPTMSSDSDVRIYFLKK